MTSNEYALLKKYSPLFRGPVLEVGSFHKSSKIPSPRGLFDSSVSYLGIDMEDGPGVDLVHDMEYPLDRKFNSIICCSVLEHCQRPWRMAKNIEDSLESGGCLFVSAPFVWRFHSYPSDYWRLSKEAYPILFPNVEWVALKYATKTKGEIADEYSDLSHIYKEDLKKNTAVVAMSTGFGVKK